MANLPTYINLEVSMSSSGLERWQWNEFIERLVLALKRPFASSPTKSM